MISNNLQSFKLPLSQKLRGIFEAVPGHMTSYSGVYEQIVFVDSGIKKGMKKRETYQIRLKSGDSTTISELISYAHKNHLGIKKHDFGPGNLFCTRIDSGI